MGRPEGRMGGDRPVAPSISSLISLCSEPDNRHLHRVGCVGAARAELGHVDFNAKLIRVRQRADTGGRIGSPKSATSGRDVPMAPMVVNTLREWKLACPPNKLQLVFPGRHGPMSHNALIRAVGSAHRFRHFIVSWLIDEGFGPKRIQTLAGHATIGITLDVFGHLFPQEDDHDRFAATETALLC
jgi:integrase